MGQLRDLPIPVPPLSNQKLFSDIFYKTFSMTKKHYQAQKVENYLFNSLTHLAFRGELTSSAADELLQQAAVG
jgi:hypothetical protein